MGLLARILLVGGMHGASFDMYLKHLCAQAPGLFRRLR